jgi:hypothetical protein
LRSHAPEADVVEVLSNGAAAAGVAASESDAAICAPIGAERHRLVVLAKAIADHPDAMTRFALVARPGPPSPPSGDDVTSLAVYIAHDRVGALLAVLTELSVRGVNLTRIESRPTRGAAGAAPHLRRRAVPRLLSAGRQQRYGRRRGSRTADQSTRHLRRRLRRLRRLACPAARRRNRLSQLSTGGGSRSVP